jgi:hypothetical protein
MDIQKKWREGYKQLKNIIKNLGKKNKERTLQPVLLPHPAKQRY